MNLTNTLAHISTWPQKYVEWETGELMMKYNSIPLTAHLSHVQQLGVLDQPLQGIHTQSSQHLSLLWRSSVHSSQQEMPICSLQVAPNKYYIHEHTTQSELMVVLQ